MTRIIIIIFQNFECYSLPYEDLHIITTIGVVDFFA